MPFISVDVSDTVHDTVTGVETAAQAFKDHLKNAAEATGGATSAAYLASVEHVEHSVNWFKKHVINVT